MRWKNLTISFLAVLPPSPSCDSLRAWEGWMRPPRQREAAKSDDLFRARLEQIMDMKHELVQLTGKIDWAWIDSQITPLYSA